MMHFHPLRKSFIYALRGLRTVFREERNFRVQIFAAVAVLVLAWFLRLRAWEILVILLVSAFVLVLELLNSVTERLIDVFRPRLHHAVAEIKDIMAGAVLVSSVTSVIVAVIIFVPYIIQLLQ